MSRKIINIESRSLLASAAATLAACTLAIAPQRAEAANEWGSTSSSAWTTGSSWVGGAVPGWGTGLDVVFYANATTVYTNIIGSGNVTMRQLYLYQTNFSGTPTFPGTLPTTIKDVVIKLTDADLTTPRVLNFQRNVSNQNGNLFVNAVAGNVTIGTGLGSVNIAGGAGLFVQHEGSGNLTFGSPITESAAGKNVSVTGAGTKVFAATNTYTGSTTVNGGTLVLATNSAIAASSGVILGNASSAVLQLNTNQTIGSLSGGGTSGGTVNLQSYTLTTASASSTSYGGLISGTTGGLTKLGTGTLTLSGTSANTYWGPTIVGGGTLGVAAVNHPSASAITVSNGAALNLDVTGGAVSVATPSLTLGTNTALTFSYGVLPGGNPFVAALNNAAATGTTLTANGTNIVINVSGSGFTAGQFPLIKYSGSIGGNGFGAFTLGTPPLGAVATLSNNTANASIDLVINAFSQVSWQGYVDGQWNNSTLNWTNQYSLAASAFTNGFTAILDDTAGGTTSLTLNGSLQPKTVIANNSTLNYSLSGAGSLGGTMSLTMNGTGSLVIATTNTYTGGTTINAGTVQLGDGVSANGSVTGDIANSGTLVMANPGAQTYAGVISGSGPLTVSGNATLSGVNTYTGLTTVTNNGTLTLSGNRTNASARITIYSGTMNIQNGNFSMGANGFYLGDGLAGVSATVNHTGGNITYGSSLALLLGNGTLSSGSTNTYNLSGGSIAGFTSTTRGVMFGVNPGDGANMPTATFNLSGSGFLNMSNSMVALGRSDAATDYWNVNFNQTGGRAVIGYLTMGGVGAIGSYNINASLNLTGGTNIVSNFAHLAEAGNNTCTIKIGGTADVTFAKFPTTAHGAGSTATLTLDGGILRPYAASTVYMQGLDNAYLTTNGANFNVASGNDITVAQAFTDAPSQAGKLTKAGAGMLTLTSGSTYSGVTTVSAGTLVVNEAFAATGSLVVSNGATLGCLSDIPGTTALLSGVTLGATNAGLLAQFTGNTGNPTAPAGYITNLTLNGVTPVSVLCNGLQVGTIPLFQYSTLGGAGSLTLGTLPQGVFGTITNDTSTKTISLVVSSVFPLAWSGASSSIWDINTSTNWLFGVTPRTYQDGNGVCLFNDAAATGTITVTQAVSPGSMVFSNNTLAYNVGASGAGVIGGSATLTKTGNGKLTLTGTNAYSGGTILSLGILQADNTNALGTGLLTMDGGTLSNNVSASLPNSVNLNTAATAGVGSGQTLSLTGVITNTGSLTKSGPGTLRLTGVNTFTGGTVVSGGTLVLDNTGHANPSPVLAANSDLTISSATVSLVGGQYNFIYNTTAGTITLNSGGILSADGSTKNQCNVYNVVMAGGTLATSGGNSGNNGGNFSVNGSVNATDNSTISADIGGGGSLSALSVDVAASKSLLISGGVNINGPALTKGLTKTGDGTLTLSATNVYTGATTVSGGTLLVNGAINAGSTVTVDAGATLGGSGTVAGTASFAEGSIATNTVGLPLTVGTLDMAGNAAMHVATAAPLSAGDYPLINYTSISGVGLFTNLTVGGAGLAGGASASVVFTNNTVALIVVGGAPTATNITYTVSGNQLVLNWPAGQGWLLQSNSVSVANPGFWYNVSGATPPFTNTVNPATPSVFFRLKY